MSLTDFFLFAILTTLFFLIIFQKVFISIRFKGSLEITIEYFPFKLILTDFGKNPKLKFKAKKISKYLSRISAFYNSARFLFRHSEISENSFNIQKHKANTDQPHLLYPQKEAFDFLEYLIRLLINASFARFIISDKQRISEPYTHSEFDFLITSRLYVIVFALAVFIFSLIKRKGWIKRIVG